MAKITVKTKTYNRAHLVPRAIESVLNQSFEDFEYIIINNGCTDNTGEILQSYAKQDSRIKIITRAVNQISSTEDRLDKSTWADYFTTVDDDDFVHPDMLQRLYDLASSTNSDICTVGSQWVYPDGSVKDKFVYQGTYTLNRVESMFELLKREKINSAAGGKLYKKCLFDTLKLPRVSRARDIYSEYRIINNISKMTITGEPMYYFYRHDSNLSGLNNSEQITAEKMNEHLYANRIRTQWLSENMPEIKAFVEYCEYSFMISMYNKIYALSVEPCYPIAEEMRRTLLPKVSSLLESEFIKESEISILKSL